MKDDAVRMRRFDAIVYRSQSELTTSSQRIVSIDPDLMAAAEISAGDVIRIETSLGRET
jgi:hypothetical protein